MRHITQVVLFTRLIDVCAFLQKASSGLVYYVSSTRHNVVSSHLHRWCLLLLRGWKLAEARRHSKPDYRFTTFH